MGNGGTDTCWVVASNDGRFAHVVSFFQGGRISTYPVAEDGTLGVLRADAARGTADGQSDVTLSRDSRFYNVNSATGRLNAHRTSENGALRLIQRVRVAPPSEMESTLGLAGS